MFGKNRPRADARRRHRSRPPARAGHPFRHVGGAKPKPGPNRKSNCPNGPSTNCSPTNASLLGFYVTGHPLTPFVPDPAKSTPCTPPPNWRNWPITTMTRIGGLVTEVQKGISKKSGKPYAMVTLEDLAGSVQILLPQRQLRQIHRPHHAQRRPCSSPAKSIVPRTSRRFSRRKSSPCKTRPTFTPSKCICACKRPI
jgi:DNA polymerase III alpha subunit